MSTTNKKAYIYKMKLGPANVLCLGILALMFIVTTLVFKTNLGLSTNTFLLFISIVYISLTNNSSIFFAFFFLASTIM